MSNQTAVAQFGTLYKTAWCRLADLHDEVPHFEEIAASFGRITQTPNGRELVYIFASSRNVPTRWEGGDLVAQRNRAAFMIALAQYKKTLAAAPQANTPAIQNPLAAISTAAAHVAACNAYLTAGGRYPATVKAKRYNDNVTKAQRLAAFKRFTLNKAHPDMRGIFTQTDACGYIRHCLCDGYHAVRLNNDVPELPRVAGGLELNRIFDHLPQREVIHLPALSDLRKYIDDAKAAFIAENPNAAQRRRKCANPHMIYNLPGTDCYVNALYLLDMMTALEAPAAYKPSSPNSPIYFTADNGDGVLLPVRTNKESSR